MKHFFGILTTSILFASIAISSYADLDCSSSMTSTLCLINDSITGLIPSTVSYSETTGLSPDPCCLKNCINNAELSGTECKCKIGYHVDNNACTVNTYTVKYDNNDINATGNAPSDHTCTYNTSCNLAKVKQNTFTNSGKSFEKWCTESAGTCYYPDEDLGTTLTTSDKVTIKLYARWENCDNSGGANGWESNCTVTSCDAGYYLARDTSSSGTTCPGTTTSCCKACTASGKYCPGGNQISETECPAGYYCPGATAPSECDPATNPYDGRCKCPVGNTSDGGSTVINDCYMRGGTKEECNSNCNCTKFCDKVGCFYLPVNVYY